MEAFKTFIWLIAFIFVVPIAAKGVALDAKLDPEPGEDETRALVYPSLAKRVDQRRAVRSFSRRWLRAANYREENILRVLDGKPVDNCPRLTRAKRNLRRSLTEDRGQSVERMKDWRETGNNLQRELDRQSAAARSKPRSITTKILRSMTSSASVQSSRSIPREWTAGRRRS